MSVNALTSGITTTPKTNTVNSPSSASTASDTSAQNAESLVAETNPNTTGKTAFFLAMQQAFSQMTVMSTNLPVTSNPAASTSDTSNLLQNPTQEIQNFTQTFISAIAQKDHDAQQAERDREASKGKTKAESEYTKYNKGQLETKLQELIITLTSSKFANTATAGLDPSLTSSAASTISGNSDTSVLLKLQRDFESIIGNPKDQGGQASLEGFLQNVAKNFQVVDSLGFIVNDHA